MTNYKLVFKLEPASALEGHWADFSSPPFSVSLRGPALEMTLAESELSEAEAQKLATKQLRYLLPALGFQIATSITSVLGKVHTDVPGKPERVRLLPSPAKIKASVPIHLVIADGQTLPTLPPEDVETLSVLVSQNVALQMALEYYTKGASKDPGRNPFVDLYEALESIQNFFGGRDTMRKGLGINRTALRKFVILANAARHAPKPGEPVKPLRRGEFAKSVEFIRGLILAFTDYLEKKTRS